MIAVLLEGLVAGLIVGFVTASIKSWVDRFFLVIILVGLLKLPILFVVIVLTALAVERIWTPKLSRIVSYVVAPILVVVGVRFLWMV